jgi:hypothetical protein
MSELKFTASTDKEHEFKLDSYLISVSWRSGVAYAGQTTSLEVLTAFVGNGAKIKIKGKSGKGKKLGTIDDKIKNNKYVGRFEIPEDMEIDDEIYFEAELPELGLKGESGRIPVLPAPDVSNMKWSAAEARRGDILTLSADIKDVHEGTEMEVTIYEYDRDNIHDVIATFPAVVENKKMEVKWEYEYHEDTDEIPTEEELQKYGRSYNPPEYFFTIKIGDAEFGREQESGILKFKDWIEISLSDPAGDPIPDEKYILHMPDGSQRDGTLDGDGYAREEEIPPGAVSVEFPNIENAELPEEESQ